jgi:hypothetical protein
MKAKKTGWPCSTFGRTTPWNSVMAWVVVAINVYIIFIPGKTIFSFET